jgi:hypothetical protein
MQRISTILALMPILIVAGCHTIPAILNPARIDDSPVALYGGAAPKNIELFAGNLDEITKNAISEKAFFPTWLAAAKAQKQDDASSTAQSMLLRGIALSDRLCSAWFQKLAEAQAKMAFERDAVSSVGGLAASIMGLSGTGAPAVAGVAAATGFGQQLIDSASANFIVAPDIGLIQDLVTQLRAAMVAELTARTPITYDDVLIQLVAYDNTCTHTKVKQLVNQSVTNSTKTAATDGTAAETTLGLELKPFFAADATLGPDQVVALYGLLVTAVDQPDAVSSTTKAALYKKLQDGKLVAKGSTAAAIQLNLIAAYAAAKEAAKATATITTLLRYSLSKDVLDAAVKKIVPPPPSGTAAQSAGPAEAVATPPPAAATPKATPAAASQALSPKTLTLPSILR